MKRIGLLAMLGLILSGGNSCSATKDLEISAVEPAAIDLHNHITRIGIVNTSTPVSQEPVSDAIGRRITKENVRLSREGQEAAITGLREVLQRDGRFDTIVFIETTPEALVGLDTDPQEIAWQSIQEICGAHELDAVFALASYDTETHIKVKKKAYLALDLIRVRNKVRGHEITVETLIENGWRIYEPNSKAVLDEFVFKGAIVSRGQGQTPSRALENLGSRQEDFIAQSREDGSKYGARLRPMKRKLIRQLYVKGSPNLEEADVFIQKDDWENAVYLWQKDIAGAKTKPKARACHNMAVWQEYQGQLNSALTWARKADETFTTKHSQAYIADLEARQLADTIVQQQLTLTGLLE